MEKISVALVVLALLACVSDSTSQRRRVVKTKNRFWPKSNAYKVFRQEAANESEETPEPEQPAAPVETVTADDCAKAGFFAYPGDCTRFYRCVSSAETDVPPYRIYIFKCGPGTVFNEKISVCDHPWAVPGCQGQAATSAPASGTSGEDSGSDSASGGSDATDDNDDTDSDGDDDEDDDDDDESSTGGSGEGGSALGPVTTTTTEKPGVFTLVCYDDSKYRRHPLYCNQYYYCIYANEVWDVPRFTCAENLVFNEDSQVCERPGEEDEGCTYAPTAPVTTEAPEKFTTPSPDETTKKIWTVDETSTFDCPAPGYYPYEGDCIRFYKCVETEEGQLKGLLYKCPEKYGYSEETQFCDLLENLDPCQRIPQPEYLSRFQQATPLYEDDLSWFFNN